MSQLDFSGKVVVVTGAGRGIGQAHAIGLAARGASVVVNDLGGAMGGGGSDQSYAQDTVNAIKNAGGTAVTDHNDVSVPSGAEAIIATAIDNFGRLDALVNNAGIIRYTAYPEADSDELQALIGVHVAGTFNMSRAAWPHFLAQGGGRIVNTTSPVILGTPSLLSYTSAKGGVAGLTKALAQEGQPHNILVNAISPMANTRMMKSGMEQLPEAENAYYDALRPELVAAAAVYLLHEECETYGEIYLVGGGRMARVFYSEAEGITKPGLTPEDVRDSWSKINDTDGAAVLVDCAAQSVILRDALEHAAASTV